ncbi:MAG TPA: TonB-dependent receptor [Bacteroidia bacterium]|nr:TonB-dependent receptor [Bacteroidia bacterium]
MKYILYVTSFLITNFLFISDIRAQQTFVNGSVADSVSGEGLIGVVVTTSQGKGGVTDVSGMYRVEVSPGTVTFTVTYTGYGAKKWDMVIEAGVDQTYNVLLTSLSRELDIVVVSSGRYEQKIGEVPISMEVIKPRMIENKNTTNLETIIDQTPGVNVTDDQANIRGGSGYSYGAGSRVLMVVDDMPMLSGDAADVKWNYLPIENVSQVEVMKGAASALFGSAAMNGVIHFRTAYPTSTPKTTLTMYSGFYDNPRRDELKWWPNGNPSFSGINFGHSRQIGNWDLVIGGHVFNDDGYRYLETEDRIRMNVNTRYRFKKIEGLTAGINVNMMRTRGGLFILWESDSLAYIPSDSAIQNFKNYRYNIDPFIVYHGAKGHNHALRTRLYVTDNNNDTEQGALAKFYYGEYQYQYRFENRLSVTAGLVGSYTDVKSDIYDDAASGTSVDGAKNRTAQNLSAYVQFDKKFFDRLFVTIGGRVESYKMDTAVTQYELRLNKTDTLKLPFRPVMRVGVNYQAAKYTYIRASYGQGYRFPCIAEKYIRTSAGGLEIYPNEELQPEYGQSAEIGVKQGIAIGKWKSYLDVAIFWMEYTNMMEFTFGQFGNPATDPFFGLGFKSVNIGKTRTRGLDISIMGEGTVGKCGLTLLAGYTYMDPVPLDFEIHADTVYGVTHANMLKYRYRHIAKFDGEVSYKKFTFGMSMRYNSFMENIDKVFIDFSFVIAGIREYRERFNRGDLVFDSRLMYQINDYVRVSMITNNLFNREYTSRPADVKAPRNFAVQLMVKF